ncbi:MAG: DUF58 domain-containing protein [Aquificaceae bacterium]|nr:DUF58 domain-containing protein [Aquificaceae bacterium]MCX7989160.1 DUF58 domain-containing protein [Aquificaceae bacterium]MDW8033199.1 DUF58 domain-containing protein [Aquificaceae bacterium]MDW8294348.1 DUF58 domain-containing protein [Aquificaceae bacterium]
MRVRYKVRVNRAGLIFIGITVFLGVAAVNTANNLLYLVVSYMLSFMLLSGLFSLYNIRGLEVVLLPPEEVYAGSETTFKVLVKNHKRLPSFLLELRKEGEQCTLPLVIREGEGSLRMSFERRGIYQSLSLEVSSSFPVGLFERFYTLEVPVKLLVFPKPLPCDDKKYVSPYKERGYASSHSRRRGYEELQGVREYAGEPIKLIHWKLSAKLGDLYVREMTEEASPPLILSLEDVEGTMEERISKLSFLIVKFASQGRPVGLRLPEKTVEPSTGVAHKRRLLTELALL